MLFSCHCGGEIEISFYKEWHFKKTYMHKESGEYAIERTMLLAYKDKNVQNKTIIKTSLY